MTLTRKTITAFLLLLLTPLTMAGTNGGYYCTEVGYIAYEFGGTHFQDKKHRLFVRFLGEDVTTKSVELPPFDVFGMRCGKSQIALQSADTMYVVRWSYKRQPKLVDTFKVPLADSLTNLPANLGERLWADTPHQTTVQLTTQDKGYYWALRLEHQEQLVFDGRQKIVHHQNLSELVKYSGTGKALDRLLIFDGVSTEVVKPCKPRRRSAEQEALSSVVSLADSTQSNFNAMQKQIALFFGC